MADDSAWPAGSGNKTAGVSLATVPAPDEGDEWVAEAVRAVEVSIMELAEEFRVHPLLHRVEHSLHARLIQLLGGQDHLGDRYPIGESGFRTQLIHKEWPETTPRKKPDQSGDRRRGSFDIAVLTPGQLRQATREQFEEGRITAPIVIEVGLNYSDRHLAGDLIKLTNSQVHHPYLIHLSRVASAHHGRTEAYIKGIGDRTKIAYVRHDFDLGLVHFRNLGNLAIATEPH